MSYYILFHSHTDGLELYSRLRKAGYRIRISPAPRAAASCCGMSLLVDSREIGDIRIFIGQNDVEIDRIVALENQIDPRRDTYC